MRNTYVIKLRGGSKLDNSIYLYPMLLLSVLLYIITSPLNMIFLAAPDRGLTGVLVSDAVKGSTKYLEYFEWYGVMTSGAISAICIICLGMCIVTLIATLGYYTDPNHWDYVDQLKSGGNNGMGNGFGGRGMQGGGYGVQGQGSGMGGMLNTIGLDSLVDAFFSMGINVKRYSDCSTQNASHLNMHEYTSAWEYLVIKGPVTFLMILFLNMGWKGTLQKMIASVVDAVTLYAEALPYEKLIEWAEWKAAQETGYTFTLGMAGNAEGKVKEQLAMKIFGKVQGIARLANAEEVQTLGSNTEAAVSAIEKHFVIPEHMKSLLPEGTAADADNEITQEIKEAIWSQLEFTCNLTTTKATQQVVQGVYIPVTSLHPASTHTVNPNLYNKYYVVISMKYIDDTTQGVFTDKYYNDDPAKRQEAIIEEDELGLEAAISEWNSSTVN